MNQHDTPAKVASTDGLGLRAWLVERYESATAIAARKTGADRAGWLEDAAYFKAAVKALDGRADAIATERERCAKVAEGFEQTRDWVPTSLYATIRADVAARIRRGPNAGSNGPSGVAAKVRVD